MRSQLRIIFLLSFFHSFAGAAVDSSLNYEIHRQKAFSKSASVEERWRALSAMALQSHPDRIKDLQKAAQQKEWFMKSASLVAMKKVSVDKAEDLALKLLSDPALVVRSQAVEVLSDRMTQLSRERLWQELSESRNFHKKKSLWIRQDIVSKMAEQPLSSEMKKFGSLLNDSDQGIQNQALRALETISGKTLGQQQDTFDKKRQLWLAYLSSN